MRARAVQSLRGPPLGLTTRRVGRGRVLLGQRPALALELEALRSAAARALSTVLAEAMEIHVRMADAPCSPAHALAKAAVLCVLALGGPGTDAVLEVDPRLVAALAARRIGGPGPEVPVLAATRFERALLGELLLGVLAALREVDPAESRWRPRLVEVGASRAQAERRLGAGPSVVVELELGGTVLLGRTVLHLPELALRLVALSLPPPRAVPRGRLGQARLSFSPRVRCGAVWPGELVALAPGAAVVPRGARWADGAVQGPLALVRQGISLGGELLPGGFRHAGAELRPASQEVTHVDPTLSELPVDLEVELARVPLSLAEIGALEPGTVLPLRVTAGDPVFLRAGDRRIARAELVDVEGEVAARILELVP